MCLMVAPVYAATPDYSNGNVDIYIRSGMSEEIIPLQVCHIGSVIAGLALIFKKKWLIIT